MRALVVGGAGSGKSAYAERLACDLCARRTYVATMANSGNEARERIERHRLQRAGRGFTTVECADGHLDKALRGAYTGGVVLLDDLGNLLANALFLPDGSMADPASVVQRLVREVSLLGIQYEHSVVVGNQVGCEGSDAFRAGARPEAYSPTLVWVRAMGTLCCALAQEFQMVVEVVAGVPCVIKGARLGHSLEASVEKGGGV